MMSDELEVAGLASAGALESSGQSGDGEQCANCEAPLDGDYCRLCGQRHADMHRPIWTLIGEGLSDSFALDGRIARTLPAIFWRPGKVTRSYLDGQRARFVPPFRLFLLSSLLFFATMFGIGDQLGWTDSLRIQPTEDGGWHLVVADGEVPEENRPTFLRADNSLDLELLRAELADEAEVEIGTEEYAALEASVEQIARVYSNQDAFLRTVEVWLPRLSLLLLPVFALALTLLYVWRRQIYVYDHLVTTLHFQSWFYLASAATMWVAFLITPWAYAVLGLAMPVYVFHMLRRVYGDGWFMASGRTVSLLFQALIALVLLVAGVSMIGAAEVAGPDMLQPG